VKIAWHSVRNVKDMKIALHVIMDINIILQQEAVKVCAKHLNIMNKDNASNVR